MNILSLDTKEVLTCVYEGVRYYEEWKPVKDYKGIYEVSSSGRVKGLERVDKLKHKRKEKILKLTKSKGYYKVVLCKNGKKTTRTVHQLVAEAFLNHTPCGYKLVVNHIDFNIVNNHISNLEIITQRENANKKHKKSSSKYTGVSWNKDMKKWHSSIFIDKRLIYLGCFCSELKASEAYNEALKKQTI